MRASTELWTVILMLCAACHASPRPAAPASAPADSVPAVLTAPAVDLTGGWTTGAANEPPAGSVRTHPGCAYNPAVWLIQQTGNALKSWTFPESYNQGIARKDHAMERRAPVSGWISGVDVVIRGEGERLVLKYDSVSQHLRGTRNGVPFWAARQVIIREACPGIP